MVKLGFYAAPLVFFLLAGAGQNNWPAGSSELAPRLRREAISSFQQAEAERTALKSRKAISQRGRALRKYMMTALDLPPRSTPLNVRTLGRTGGEGFDIERLIWESQPGFYVTANLYLPHGVERAPAVLLPCGHHENAKAAPEYQLAAMLLARTGMAVLLYDPIGQGERKQILTADQRGALPSTTEHNAITGGAILVGRSAATYRIWDGIRALDLLQQRKEIDPNRLGCTGNSGGGTLTSYLNSVDDRIAAAAPGCYLTTWERLLLTLGPQDAEQNIFGQAKAGLDHPDYVLIRAPSPLLIGAAKKDFFDITGTRSLYAQVQSAYKVMGRAERVAMVEADESHGFTRPLREATAAWMSRWLLNKEEQVIEPVMKPNADYLLQCVTPAPDRPGGQVLQLKGARSVIDLNLEQAMRLSRQRAAAAADAAGLIARVRELSGARSAEQLPACRVETAAGAAPGEGSHLLIETGLGARLAASRWGAVQPLRRVIVFPSAGREAWFRAHADEIRNGPASTQYLVVDLPFNDGSPAGPESRPSDGDAAVTALAYLLGRSRVAVDLELMLQAVRAVQSGSETPLTLRADGRFAAAALHLAAMEAPRFARVEIAGGWNSYLDIVKDRDPRDYRNQVVHRALAYYDLPDLAALLGDRLLWRPDSQAARGPR